MYIIVYKYWQIKYQKALCVRTQCLIIIKNTPIFRLLFAKKFAILQKPPTFAPAKHKNSNVPVLANNPTRVKRLG